MKLSKEKKFKLQTLFNLKYIECLMPSMHNALSEGAADYSFSNLNLEFDQWNTWKISHGIKEKVEDKKDYVQIEGVANSTMYIPKEFVEKILILGFLP